jgi:hypothetical protein
MKKLLSVLVTLMVVLASCATHDHHHHGHHHHHDHDHHHGAGDGRLFVATANGDLWLLDAHDGDLIAKFHDAVPEGSITLYASFTGEFGYVINRAAHTVAAVHSGQALVEHDGHEDLVFIEPRILGTFTGGLLPTHFNNTLGRAAFFNDQSGDLTVVDESILVEQGLAAAASITPSRVDHGAMILLSDGMLVGYLNHATVERMDYQGNVVQVFENAPRLHGQARIGRTSAFGLANGVMIIEQSGRNFSAFTIPNPSGTPDNVRVGTLVAHPLHDFFVGNFGQGVALIRPTTRSIEPFNLPTIPWRFAFDRTGKYVAVLGRDGILYALEVEDDGFHIHSQVQVVPPHNPNAPAGTPIPSLTMGNGIAFVSNPADNTILEVHLHDGDIEAVHRLDTNSPITGLVLLVTDGIIH